jgi:hypothetical protein
VVVRTADETLTLRDNDLLDLSELLPGLRIMVSDLFAALDE